MFNFDEMPDRINEKCRKWDRKIIEKNFGAVPEEFIPLWIADLDFRIPTKIEEAFSEAVKRGIFGYTYCYEEFYEAIIEWQQTMHAVAVEKEWITLTYGTVSTIHYSIQAFCEPGDYILMNTPVYQPFDTAAEKQGVNRIYNSLIKVNNRYEIDFQSLKNQLEKYKPKVYLFCSPHNPSGRIWSREELQEVIKCCKESGTVLIVDEVHAEHIHYGEFHSIFESSNEKMQENIFKNSNSSNGNDSSNSGNSGEFERIILLTSPNKGFNLGGLKTSYSIIPSRELRAKFRRKLEQNSVTSPNVFGIIGLITAYKECKPWLKEVNEYIKENYEIFEKYIEKHIPSLKVMKMESSYLAWVDISKTKLTSSEVTSLLAAEVGVLVEDGSHFVKDGEKYIRVNLGTQRKNIIEVLKRMEKIFSL